MKIIEALKKIKDLKRKCDDVRDKVKKYCADLDCETPSYPDQKKQVSEWIQSHGDMVKEIGRLRTAVLKTNLNTMVSIEVVDGIFVKKSIAEWIDRRRELAKMEESLYRDLTDKGLKDTYQSQMTPNSSVIFVKKRLYFDPVDRDTKIEMYRSEPSLIDSTLETINAVTDLI